MAEYVVEYKDDGLYRKCAKERVVRCRDCSMYDAEDGMCTRDPEHTGRGWYAYPDGFCAWGERRGE